MHKTSHKKGLVRSFIVIVFGILFLSYIGFDLRTKVSEFQEEHSESINFVKQTLFELIVPTAEDLWGQINQFATSEDGEFDPDKFKELYDLYSQFVPELKKFVPEGLEVPKKE